MKYCSCDRPLRGTPLKPDFWGDIYIYPNIPLGILRGKDWEMLLGKQNDQIYVLDSGNIMEDEVGRREVRGREIIWNIAVFVGVKMK